MILDLAQINQKYNLKINGIIHIGAHHGGEHELYKNLNVSNLVYFEPVKKTFDVLRSKISDAILHNCALGNETKSIEMFIEDVDACGCSSILEPNFNLDWGTTRFSNKEIVEMKRLDDFNYTFYNFLNIDVQGYELEVLKGSEKTLNHIDYIMCEINRNTEHKEMVYKDAPSVNELNNFLGAYGFELVEQDWAGVSWGDGFYIKK